MNANQIRKEIRKLYSDINHCRAMIEKCADGEQETEYADDIASYEGEVDSLIRKLEALGEGDTVPVNPGYEY